MSKINVWGWAADSAGCQTYRIRWVADAINRLYGDEINYRFGTIAKPDDREWADVIIGQRVVLPGPTMFWQDWAKEGNKKLILEFDDDLFTVTEDNTRASRIFNKGQVRDRLKQNVLAADLVTVSTEPLKVAINRETGYPLDQILVIPNAVDPGVLENPLDRDQMDGAPTLGWLASPTHGPDSKLVSRHLKRFLENNPDARFHTIGADYGKQMGLNPDQVIHTTWTRPPEAAFRKIDYRVGIAPLVGSAFNRSKSDCKFLEMGARKVAPLVSDVMSYSSVIHGETGYKVRYEHEWGRSLRTLCADDAMQRELAENAHDYVKNHRTTNHTAPLWRAAILDQ